MANPRNLWVRDALQHNADIGTPQHFWVDLLWKARTGQNIQGSNALLQAQPAATPREIFDRPLAPQDISGALVQRIFVSYTVGWGSIPPTVATDQTQLARWGALGMYEGIYITNSKPQGYGQVASDFVGDEADSVTVDWMHWRRRYALSQVIQFTSSTDPTPVNFPMAYFEIDVKSKRRLKEWDDTVVLVLDNPPMALSASTGETINNLAVCWSVLLETVG